MSAFGGKADIAANITQCPLLTQSGHGRFGIDAVQTDRPIPVYPAANPCRGLKVKNPKASANATWVGSYKPLV